VDCIKYEPQKHFELVCNWLDDGYHDSQLESGYFLRTRWEYLHAFTIFPFGTFNTVLLWFIKNELVAIALSERNDDDLYLICNKKTNINYNNMISDLLKQIKSNHILFIDKNNNLLNEAVLNAGFKKSGKKEVERQIIGNPLTHELKSDPSYILKCFENEYINQVAQLLCDAFSNTQNKRIIEKNLKHMIKVPFLCEDSHFLLFESDNQNIPISYCGYWLNREKKYAMIEPLVTHPSFQKKQLSTRIVCESMLKLSNQGIKYFHVTSNHEFYKKVGFNVIGERVNYVLN